MVWASPFSPELDAPLGEDRILVICSPDDIAIKSQQIDWAGYEERHITIVEVRQGKLQNSRIRDIAQCDNKREYILIGKDQTRKKRWDEYPTNDDLYATIDAMPMRRFEMRQKMEKRRNDR